MKAIEDGPGDTDQTNTTQGATGGSDVTNELRIDEADVTTGPVTQTDINSANQNTASAAPINASES